MEGWCSSETHSSGRIWRGITPEKTMWQPSNTRLLRSGRMSCKRVSTSLSGDKVSFTSTSQPMGRTFEERDGSRSSYAR